MTIIVGGMDEASYWMLGIGAIVFAVYIGLVLWLKWRYKDEP